MLFLKAIFLGIIEGLTEFLPISSTGHLIIVDNFIKLSSNVEFVNAFEVIIQLGAICAVLVIYWPKLLPLTKVTQKIEVVPSRLHLWGSIIIAFIPAAILGFLFDKKIESYLFNPWTVAIALIFYGLLLLIVEFILHKKTAQINEVTQLSWRKALGIGLFQCLALVPGTSRSLATILGAQILGLTRTASAEFSFFLALPTMIAATGFKLLSVRATLGNSEWLALTLGFITAFIIALLVIKIFMNYIKKYDFKLFAYYRIALGIIVIVLIQIKIL